MDNAARALLIAGGILVGVLIISLGAYLLTAFRSAYSVNMSSLYTSRVANFNSKFTGYGSRISGYQAWNILSYVKETNDGPSATSFHVDSNGGDITCDNYKQRLFFMDSLLATYEYSYFYGPNGTVNRVVIDIN